MDQKEFLARVLPSGNHYIAFPSGKKTQDGRPIFGHSSFIEPHAGIAIADRTASRNLDVYFALASFKQAKIHDATLGKEKSYRKQANVAALKCLFLDLDFKNYDSPEQTIQAFGDFLQASKLEKPSIIVNTGGGLHIYWTFPEPIPLTEWQPLANGLAGVAENLGLKADLQCTIDSARILRVPGYRNLKYDPPRIVDIIASRPEDVDPIKLAQRLHGVTSIRARSGRAPRVNLVVDPAVANMFPDSNADDLGQGVGAEYTIARMVKAGGCPLIADMLARNGDGDSRDLWNNMLLLTAYATDGRAMAHELSKGDPRYTEAETDAEFDMKLADRDKLGPTSCDTFSHLTHHCSTCPHRGKIKSPIVLGKPEPVVVPLVAEPTFVENKATWIRVDTEEGLRTVMLFDMPMDRPVLIDTPGAARLEITFRGPPRTRTIIIECGKIQGRDYLPGQFGAQAMPYPKHLQKLIEGSLMAWTTLLRNESTAVDAPAFGWSDGGFSLNGDLYTTDGQVRRVGVSHENVTAGYGIKGEPGAWQTLASAIIADPRTELQILLATAFAAPLIEFTELSSTAIVLRSPNSGVGKTSVMKLARAVYGDPEDMAQATDTPMAVEMKLASLTNMPWYWDEVKVPDDKKMSDTIYQILQGKSKARGRPDGSLRSVSKTHGMLVMATNLSLREIMQEAGKGTDAGSLRVFEMDLSARGNRTADQVFSGLIGKLHNNYGHVGQVYAAYLATHRAQAEALVHQMASVMNASGFVIEEQERYWATSAKVIIAGALLATQAGICTFDCKRMLKHFQTLLGFSRSVAVTSNAPEEIAARIWRYYANRSLITDEFHLATGAGKPKTVHTEQLPDLHHGSPRARLAYLTNTLLLSKEGVREFAQRQGHQPELYYNSIDTIAQLDRTSIDKGVTSMGSKVGREWVYILNAEDILGVDEVQQWVSGAAARGGATPGSSSGSAPSGSTAP